MGQSRDASGGRRTLVARDTVPGIAVGVVAGIAVAVGSVTASVGPIGSLSWLAVEPPVTTPACQDEGIEDGGPTTLPTVHRLHVRSLPDIILGQRGRRWCDDCGIAHGS